jgi:hypothetical protein
MIDAITAITTYSMVILCHLLYDMLQLMHNTVAFDTVKADKHTSTQ